MDTKNPGKFSGRTFYTIGRNNVVALVSDRVLANIYRKEEILAALKTHKGLKSAALAHLDGPIFTFCLRGDAKDQPWMTGPVELVQRLKTYIYEHKGTVVHKPGGIYVPFSTWTPKKIRVNDLNYVTTPEQFEFEFGISIPDLLAGKYVVTG